MKKTILLLLLLTSTLRAAPVPLTDPAKTYDLFRASSLLEVRPGQVTIDSLLRYPGYYHFVPTQNGRIHPNDRQNAYWFRVEVSNQTAEAFFLHFVYSGTEHIRIYEVADNRVVAMRQMGRLVPETQDYFRYSKLFFPIQGGTAALNTAKGQTRTLYIYMDGIYTTCLYFNARSAANLLGVIHYEDLFYGLYYGFILIIVVYSLLLFIRLGEQDTFRYAIWVLSIGLQLGLYRGFTAEFLWSDNPSLERYGGAWAGLSGLLHVLFTMAFLRLREKRPSFYRLGLGVIAAYGVGIVLFLVSVYQGGETGKNIDVIPLIALAEGLFSVTAGVLAYRQGRGFKPALYYVIGNLTFFVSIFIFLQYASGRLPHSFWTYNSLHIGSGIEIILFTLALVYKVDLLKRRQEEAVREQLRLAETNKWLVEEQNAVLEAKVRQRTDELNVQKEGLQTALITLQDTQEQLIQKEKMASLGEMMAGIAHEIQNPLNFVNNFAEVSAEMLDELKDEIKADHKTDALALADELVPNLQKINHHGKRAESIVRDMLQHSRSTIGTRQPADLNALADECLHLAYQGFLVKEKTSSTGQFNVLLLTDFDPAVGQVDIMPQEISRVLLNLFNNAFYAVQEKQKNHRSPPTYQPTITVTTTRTILHNHIPAHVPEGDTSLARPNGLGPGTTGSGTNGTGPNHDTVTIRIRDNGTGIPHDLLNKIYQPFFTTKPPGQGTGLGLSLSYDIITKSHGGQLDVKTEVGNFTEFTITLTASKPVDQLSMSK